jgi:Rrf2 family protein
VRITKFEEYGVRLVVRLASDGGQLTIRELAEREGIPEATVAKVIAKLRRSAVVRAERGRNGGYELTEAADRLTVAQVVEAFDDRLYDPGFCDRMAPGESSCSRASGCGLRPMWRGLTAVIGNFLAGITVADLLAGGPRVEPGSLPLVAVGRRA